MTLAAKGSSVEPEKSDAINCKSNSQFLAPQFSGETNGRKE